MESRIRKIIPLCDALAMLDFITREIKFELKFNEINLYYETEFQIFNIFLVNRAKDSFD
jgi:hypothetical protein